MSKLKEYILENWENTIRFNPQDDTVDGDIRIGLPKPYTVPSIANHFQEMYYWDTYFINRGLIISGRIDQAINNTENMFYLIDKYGFMLNGNRHCYLNNSQPPFLSIMVKEIFEITKDKEWLKNAVYYLEKEYKFWDEKRKTGIGLTQYSCNKEGAIAANKYKGFVERISKYPEGHSNEDLSCQYITICESGWDITPRWGFETENFVQVELNALMFAFESNMADFYCILGINGAEEWAEKAENRKALMNKYMLKDGVFYDYNFKTGEISNILSSASFYPMFVEMVTPEQAKALDDILCRLEVEYGIAATETQPTEYTYQWAYPNGWAPQQNLVMQGLAKYGYKEDATRVAQKYVDLVETNFEKTNNIWEKYNVVTGGIDVADESSHRHSVLPPMMGWTAGVYLEALKYIEEGVLGL